MNCVIGISSRSFAKTLAADPKTDLLDPHEAASVVETQHLVSLPRFSSLQTNQ
jgi:hypothetical protein